MPNKFEFSDEAVAKGKLAMLPMTHEQKLEHLRKQIEAETISWHELAELQDLGAKGLIPEGDTVLLEWAGIEENPD